MASTGVPMVIWPNRLREVREAHGAREGRKLFLEEVATACGCSIGNLSRIEKGYVKPGAALLATLADYYGVPALSLQVEAPAARCVGETHVIGAFVRQRRTDERTSLGDFARRLEKASGASVSVSLLRLIEKGQRRFVTGDSISDAIVALMKEPSLDALRARAFDAFEAGELAEVLETLNGEPVAHVKALPLYADGRAGELDVPTPPSLARRIPSGEPEYAVRLDRTAFGPLLPSGTFFVARRGLPLPSAGFAVVWEAAEPKVVRLFTDAERGLVGLRDRPRTQIEMSGVRADTVSALVLPD